MKKKQVKKDMLKMLSNDMRKMSHESMEDMEDKPMKVTVAADSKEGLKKGLSKAEEIMKARKSSNCK